MAAEKSSEIDYADRAVQEEILVRQRRELWTPEQIASLATHFRLAPGMAMLDVGCGHGFCLCTFGPHCMPGGRLVGVDREAHLLETASQTAAGGGLGDAAEFHEADLYALPFDADTFDMVTIHVVMCHLADPERALDEMIRVTKPGGGVAVFDNAVGGFDEGLMSTFRPTLRQMLLQCEQWILAARGRKKLRRGDWAVGLKMPGWMEARGLNDVDARVNERVYWMAPPYRSPHQRNAVQSQRERARDRAYEAMDIDHFEQELRAGGADERMIRNARRTARQRNDRWHAAVEDGTAAMAHGGDFWCVWGFKP